jgi:hypothetical protein
MKYYRRGVNGSLVETKGPDWDVVGPSGITEKHWAVPGGVRIRWYRGFDGRKDHPAYLTVPGEGTRPIRRSDAARIIAGVRRNLRQRAA